jgi:hypothetical protein
VVGEDAFELIQHCNDVRVVEQIEDVRGADGTLSRGGCQPSNGRVGDQAARGVG